jgi:hypothetical protein
LAECLDLLRGSPDAADAQIVYHGVGVEGRYTSDDQLRRADGIEFSGDRMTVRKSAVDI